MAKKHETLDQLAREVSKLSRKCYIELLDHVRHSLETVKQEEGWSYLALANELYLDVITLRRFLRTPNCSVKFQTCAKMEKFLMTKGIDF